MAVTGKTTEGFEDFKLYAGLVEVNKILGVNPNYAERAEFYERELTEKEKTSDEILYHGENIEGFKKIDLLFYLSLNHPIVKVQKYRIELVNKERKNKEGDKFQVINQTGDTTFVFAMEDDETKPDLSLLPDWFTHFIKGKKGENQVIVGDKKVRVALVGEEQLMTLLKSAYKIDKNDPNSSISYDYNKFFKGDVKELNNDLTNKVITKTFVTGIDVSKSKEGDKYYQNVYGKQFLPGGILKFLQNRNFPNSFLRDQFSKFVENANGEYGVKGYMPFENLSEYNPLDDDANMEGAIASDSTSSKFN